MHNHEASVQFNDDLYCKAVAWKPIFNLDR
jgi:hypothetical protein